MKKFVTPIIAIIIVAFVGFLVWRYFVGQGKGAWVCKEEEWVRQGFPRTAKPTGTCVEGEIVSDEVSEEQPSGGVGFERSKEIAQEAVENSPTYKFDGFDLKFESSEELPCADCWEFTFSFKSRAGDYGDRTGQAVIQVITPHTTTVTTQEGKVTSVVTDKTYDELRQRFLK